MARTSDAELRAVARSLTRQEKKLDLVVLALRAVAAGAVAREHITGPMPVGPVRLVGKACQPRQPGPR